MILLLILIFEGADIMNFPDPHLTKISLSSLIVNPDNARYIEPGQAKDEIEAMSKLVEIEGDSIIELAKSINTYGFYPTDNLIISDTHLDGQYLVLEGNRRVTCLKLMSIYNNKLEQFNFKAEYKSTFSKLHINIDEVPVAIYKMGDPRPESIIKQLHESSAKAGRHRWDPIAQERNRERNQEYTPSLAILDMALHSEHVQESVKEKLRSTGRWYSKLQHVARMKLFRETFGLTVNSNFDILIEFDEVQTMEAISHMLLHMLARGDGSVAGSDYFSAPKKFLKYLSQVFPADYLPDRKLISRTPSKFNASTKLFTIESQREIKDCPYYDPKLFEESKDDSQIKGVDIPQNKIYFTPKESTDCIPPTSNDVNIEGDKTPVDDITPPTDDFKDQNNRRPRNTRETLIAPNDFLIPARHKKALNLYNSLSSVNMRNIDLVSIGLRSLIEYTINTYLIEIQNDTRTPYNIQIDFSVKLKKVTAHMSSLGKVEYGESELRKRIPKIFEIIASNPKIDYLGIPALHLFVHSHDYNAEKVQVENIYASFKEFLKISWEIIATKN